MSAAPRSENFNPWRFIPLLYFTQAVPVFIVQTLSSFVFKDLGVDNAAVATYTALLGLPWSFQMILGPFVELNRTRRWWIATMQLGIAAGLVGSAFALQLPNAFAVSLVLLGASGIMSALCNIAIDGFAVLAMDADQRGMYAGMMSTFFRLGRLFCVSLLVWGAGMLMRLPALENLLMSGLEVKQGDQTRTLSSASLRIESGLLKATSPEAPGTWTVQPEIKPPAAVTAWRIETDGRLFATNATGETLVATLPNVANASSARSPFDARTSWFLVFLGGGLLYLAMVVTNRVTMPRPAKDTPFTEGGSETRANLGRTGALFLMGLGVWFMGNALGRLVGHALAKAFPESALKQFRLPDANLVFGRDLGVGPVMTEVLQFLFCAMLFGVGFAWARRTFPGSEMGRALGSFVRQPGFGAIFFFILFYRFAEVLVDRISPLFLKSSLAEGGLAIPNEVLGPLSGIGGLAGLIVGGFVGGAFISKLGLKRSFWPLALSMHVPNLLYLGLATGSLPLFEWNGQPLGLGILLFVDQFGYGFGFTGYSVYLIWMAQRGSHQTSHYAIGTGMGALTGVLAGLLAGLLIGTPPNFVVAFIGVIFMALPGMFAILMVPLDESHRQIRAEVE